ncbi:hypothetical protein HYX10_00285 [Candidatus Woesearchaeota archaeon]|nr:hypothetical protein [Candidatus Woesearchaeota archaeon]
MAVQNKLQDALESMRQEEAQKKKNPAFHVPQEKRLQYYSGWDRKKNLEKVFAMEEEVGRVKKNDTTEIVVKVDDYGGQKGVTIREFLTSEKYTGFTKQGTRIPAEKWEAFKGLVNKVNIGEEKQ